MGMLQAVICREDSLNFLFLTGLLKDKKQLRWFGEEETKDVRKTTKGIEKRGN